MKKHPDGHQSRRWRLVQQRGQIFVEGPAGGEARGFVKRVGLFAPLPDAFEGIEHGFVLSSELMKVGAKGVLEMRRQIGRPSFNRPVELRGKDAWRSWAFGDGGTSRMPASDVPVTGGSKRLRHGTRRSQWEPGRMSTAAIVSRAFEAFRREVEVPPPLTLRGGNAVDGYDLPTPFDSAVDEPTDTYLEGFAYWGLGYLDARSWRHYLPRLIDYAIRRPDDPAMVTEALVRSLRPPDRYPPRLATLTATRKSVVRSFLELAALGDAMPHVQTDAQQALDEWWLPNARSRPTADETAALRATPVAHRVVAGDVYRVPCPRRSSAATPGRSRRSHGASRRGAATSAVTPTRWWPST